MDPISDAVTDDADSAEGRPTWGASVDRGVSVISKHLRNLPNAPGVYRMVGAKGEALYVGKAKSLKKRVAAYAHPDRQPIRIRRMIAQTVDMEFITTQTEVEALLLENNLIKQLKPRFNVSLRDDKSFPYILLTRDHDWPKLIKYRGSRDRPGEYFGPFASAGAVNRTLATFQRVFPLRSCSDGMFASRTRPCLQYQIKRCTAPCVGRIERDDYERIVDEARAFLNGKSTDLHQRLSDQMQAASDAMEFETAAIIRDRIRALSHIQTHQDVHVSAVDEADVVAVHQDGGQTCVQVFFFRAGQNFGNRTYFPNHTADLSAEEVIQAFLGQFYTTMGPPRLVLVSHRPPEEDVLSQALAVRAGRKVEITRPLRGTKRNLLDHALANAREALARRMAENATQRRLLEGVADLFGLDGTPRRIEVYDNSHISGSNPVGAMIVSGPDGLVKNAYRKFNIKGTDIAPGDDFAMVREVMTRRFARALKEDPDGDQGTWPDLVLIDGGPGQLSSAITALADLGIDDVPLVGISKGPDRNAGRERFHVPDRTPFALKPNDPVLYFLQRLRDEAHRFAIGSHRARRSRDIGKSPLDEISGIGARRKRALLHYFGSAAAVARAGLADLEKVDGISKGVARKIYDHFRSDG